MRPTPCERVPRSLSRRSMAAMERVTGIGGVFQRAGGRSGDLLDWYAEHLGIEKTDWGAKPFEWTPGGSTTWAVFDHDTEYFGRPDQAAGAEVLDAAQEAEGLGRFGWAVDPEGNRFELWEPPPGG